MIGPEHTRIPGAAALVLSLALLGAGAVRAADVRQLRAGCVESLAGDEPLFGGIATPRLEAKAFVQHCDGQRFRVSIRDGGIRLDPTDEGQQVLPLAAAMAADPPLPDGTLTAGRGRIAWAWLSGPTEIYGHGILGDGIEASGLQVQLRDESVLSLSLDSGSVFEDLRVRLVDLNGDGEDELVVIRSYLDRGAALAVYGLAKVGLAALGETPAIGQPHRWLNPAAAADFDGDGAVEIALVETPHIGGILRLFELKPDGLRLEHRQPGFSNHAIGSRVLDMAAAVDWNGDGIPDLALPDAARRRMTVVSFAGGRFVRLAELPHDAAIVTAVLATDLDGDGAPELLYGLGDGTLVLARP